MALVPRLYSISEIASEAGCPEDRVLWLSDIGLLTPDTDGRFSFGDVLASKMVSALLESGLPAETIERAVAGGFLSFQRTDEYLPTGPVRDPGARSPNSRRAQVRAPSSCPRS